MFGSCKASRGPEGVRELAEWAISAPRQGGRRMVLLAGGSRPQKGPGNDPEKQEANPVGSASFLDTILYESSFWSRRTGDRLLYH